MRGELQAVETPTLVVLPPPSRGGRYRFEWRPAGELLACGHRAPRALLWLIFLEGDA